MLCGPHRWQRKISMKIKILGSGSGLSFPDRFQSSIALIEEADRYVLLDCGEPAGHQLARYGLALQNLAAIYISHLHADHVSGLFQLIQNLQIGRRTEELKILMPQEGHRAFLQFLDAIYLSDKVIRFPLTLRAPEDAEFFGSARIQILRTRHLDDLARISGNPGESNTCVLTYSEGADAFRIVYSGDLQAADELLPLLVRPTRILIVEMAHFPPDTLFQMLASAPNKPDKVLLTHLGPKWANQENAIRETARAHGLSDVDVATDGLEMEI